MEATTTQTDYRPQDYTQDQINAGQRKINYALTQADKALIEVLTMLKEAIQAPPGKVQGYADQICEKIEAATKAINYVASIRPPGCDSTWTPPPPEPKA
jgi:hypothetical protein